MGLVALLSTLAAARASPEPRTFDRLCTIRAATTGGHDSNGDYYGGFSTNSLVHHERRVCGAPSQYMSAVAIGSRAYLAPFRADHIGVVDVSSSTFSTISMPDDGATSEVSQYIGAAAIGATVYFAPFDEDNVGVLNTVSSTFSTIRLDGVLRGGQNYADAVAVGTTVYMSPWSQDGVGVLDTVTSTYSTIDVAATHGAINKYWGAAALGTHVYFAPFYSVGILVLDISTSTLSTISTSAADRAYRGYASALVLGTKVYFAPRCETNIGVLETTSSTFSIIDITQRPWSFRDCSVQAQRHEDGTAAGATVVPGPPSFSMAAVGTKVYVVPDGQRGVGVLDTVDNVFFTINGTITEQAYAGAVAVGSKVVFAPCIDDNVGVLQSGSAAPPATGSSPTPDCSDAAAPAASRLSLPPAAPPPPLLPDPAPAQVLRPTALQIALLSAGCFLCVCTVLGALSYRAARRAAALRRSRDRAQGDLQLLAHQARPHSWGPDATPPVSLPPAPPSTSAGGSAAGDAAAVRGAVTAMYVTNSEAEQVLTLMPVSELEHVLVNEMPGLAQPDQQELTAPPPEAAADEIAALLEGVHQGEQPQSKRLRRNVSDEALGGRAPQSCSSSGPSGDAPIASLEDNWTAFSTSASRALAAAHAHRTSVSDALDASASSSPVHGTDDGSTSAESGGVDGPEQQAGEQAHSALPAPTPQPETEALLRSRPHACKSCKRAKVACVDDQRPCARCVRLGLSCDEAVHPVKRACTNCSRSKVKCDLDAGNDPCSRCRRLGLVCVPLEHTPSHEGRRKKRMSRSSDGDDDAQAEATGSPTRPRSV